MDPLERAIEHARINYLIERAVAAERKRCVKIIEACQTGARSGILRGSCDVYALLNTALAAIRKGE